MEQLRAEFEKLRLEHLKVLVRLTELSNENFLLNLKVQDLTSQLEITGKSKNLFYSFLTSKQKSDADEYVLSLIEQRRLNGGNR